MERIDWSEGAKRNFEERTEGIRMGERGVEEEMERLIIRVKKEMKVKRWKKKEGGRNKWWDEKCKRKKRKMARALKVGRKGSKEMENYSVTPMLLSRCVMYPSSSLGVAARTAS